MLFDTERGSLRFIALILILTLASCGGGDSRGRFAYRLTVTGLPDSSTQAGHYEGWAVVKGVAVSTGKFVVDGTGPDAVVMNPERTRIYGTASSAEFGPSRTELGDDFPFITEASHLFFTLEPEGDRDQVPSCNVILAGVIGSESAVLSSAGVPVAAGFPCAQSDGQGGFVLGLPDFSQASGSFMLLSPTDDITNSTPNDFAGVWFVAPTAGTQSEGVPPAPNFNAGLDLPVLGSNQRYEAWAVVDGITRSLGTFRSGNGRDDDASIANQRGPDGPGFEFPGGDFVLPFTPAFAIDPPALDLTSSLNFMDGDYRAFITVEPSRDNSRAPFPIELLSAVIPPDAVDANLSNILEVSMTAQTANLPAVSATVTPTAITLTNISLQDLGAGTSPRLGHYELWLDINGNSFSAGRFLINGSQLVSLDTAMLLGTQTSATFDSAGTGVVSFPDGTQALSIYVTFEDEADNDGQPNLVLVAGALSANQSNLSLLGDGMGLGLADFSSIAGIFQTSTPTNNDGQAAPDDNAGIHFRRRNIFFDFFSVGLDLPALPSGFVYEAWVEDRMSGRQYSTGRFRDGALPDEDHSTSPSEGGERPFNLPGKDFLFDVPQPMFMAAQAGSITEVFITIESIPDNSAAPSFLRILEATLPAMPATGVSIPLSATTLQSLVLTGNMNFSVTN